MNFLYKENWWKSIPLFLILLVCVLLYCRVLAYAYVWDDILLFLDRTGLLDSNLEWSVLSTPVLPGTSYFRPLVFLSFYAEFHFFGQSSHISHAINLGIFLLNIIFLYLVAESIIIKKFLNKEFWRVYLVVLLYAFHPALIESVVWVSGRFDLLVTTFILLSVLFFIKFNRGRIRDVLISIFVFCAAMSKELGVLTPIVIFIISIYFSDNGLRLMSFLFVNRRLFLLNIIAIIFYLLIRFFSIGEMYHQSFNSDVFFDSVFNQMLPLQALFFYFKQAAFPFYDISVMHPIYSLNIGSYVSYIKSILVLAILSLVFYKAFFRKSLFFIMLSIFMLLLAPVLYFVPLSIGGNIGHDRFMTAPLIFFALACGCFDFKIKYFNRIYVFLGLVFWLLLSSITINSVLPFWRSNLYLWHWTYTINPHDSMVHGRYLDALFDAGLTDVFEREISKIYQSGEEVSLSNQLTYNVFLVNGFNSRGLLGLKNIINNIPKFHDLNVDPDRQSWQYLSKSQIGALYYNYTNALVLFESDIVSAEKYHKIAEWYFPAQERMPLYYQSVFLQLVNNDESKAKQEMLYLQHQKYYHNDGLTNDVSVLFGWFCHHTVTAPQTCHLLTKNGMLSDQWWLDKSPKVIDDLLIEKEGR